MKKKNKTILKADRPDDRSPGLIQLNGATADALADMALRVDGLLSDSIALYRLRRYAKRLLSSKRGYCTAIH